MGSPRVVLHLPLFDYNLRLLQGLEDFSIEAFVPQLAVEALTVAVLPRASGFNVHSPGPVSHSWEHRRNAIWSTRLMSGCLG